MFAPAYFAPRHFAPRYFAPNLDLVSAFVDRTDAPIGQSGQARRWLRSHVAGETYDSIRDALRAIDRAQRKPTKKSVKKAVKAARAAVGSVSDPYDLSTVVRVKAASAEMTIPSLDALLRARKQLELIILAIEAFRRKEIQEEEALIALLLAT